MKAIKQAPNYSLNEKNEIINNKTGIAVSAKDGKIRLMVDGQRKSFKVSDLISEEKEEKPKTIIIKKSLEKAAKESDAIETAKEIKAAKKVMVVVKKTAKANKETSKTAKESPAELIKKGIYPYNIKNLEEIKAKIETLAVGDSVSFIDYATKKTVTGTITSHTKFSDHYPAARVSIVDGKNKSSKLISYTNLTKK